MNKPLIFVYLYSIMKFNLKYLKKNKWFILLFLFAILVLVSVYYYYSNDCIEVAEPMTGNDKFKSPKDASEIAINMLIDAKDKCKKDGDCVSCAQELVDKITLASETDKNLLPNLQKWSPTLHGQIMAYKKPNADKSVSKSSQLITSVVSVANTAKDKKKFGAAQIANFQPANCRTDKPAASAKPAAKK
jgi:hypothetical protein